MPPSRKTSAIKVFISHRTADAPIATVIRDALQNLGVAAEDIFFTSTADQNRRPSFGEFLQLSLAKGLHDCNLFVLVYTRPDDDWQWCMWELGMAQDTQFLVNNGKFDTRVVIFQCGDQRPKIAQGLLCVTIDEESILNFVRDLCTQDGFIPGRSSTLAQVGEGVLKREAAEFYKQLKAELPRRPAKEVWRWDWFKLSLSAKDISEYDKAHDEAKAQVIHDRATVTQAFGSALDHFKYNPDRTWDPSGMFTVNDPATLAELITRWKRAQGFTGDDIPAWGQEIVAEITKSISEDPADPQRQLMKSATAHLTDWYYPIVNHVTRQADGSMDFIVYMYRLESAFSWLDDAGLSSS